VAELVFVMVFDTHV